MLLVRARCLALGFLSVVTDRFGLWAPLLGPDKMVWESMGSFTTYTDVLLSWILNALMPVFAWAATVAEIALGVSLLMGFRLWLTALLTIILSLTFAFSILFFVSVKALSNYSVFAAAACAYLLYKHSK